MPSGIDSTASVSRPEDVIPSAAKNDTLSPQMPGDLPTTRTDALLQEILLELRRQREGPAGDFSVTKLMAGMTQVLALGMMFLAPSRVATATPRSMPNTGELPVGVPRPTLLVATSRSTLPSPFSV